MIKIVLDTNIIISAVLTPTGNCAKIVSMITDDDHFELYYSHEILAEYRLVLSRDELDIAPETQNEIYTAILNEGIAVKIAEPSSISFKDESDRVFYDTATQSKAFLITGNKKHFPRQPLVVTPAEFLTLMKDAAFD
jgi:putative PIN family toxin of toxin-antitoxin system